MHPLGVNNSNLFAQLLVAFVSQLRELFGFGEEFLGFLREGLQQ